MILHLPSRGTVRDKLHFQSPIRAPGQVCAGQPGSRSAVIVGSHRKSTFPSDRRFLDVFVWLAYGGRQRGAGREVYQLSILHTSRTTIVCYLSLCMSMPPGLNTRCVGLLCVCGHLERETTEYVMIKYTFVLSIPDTQMQQCHAFHLALVGHAGRLWLVEMLRD